MKRVLIIFIISCAFLGSYGVSNAAKIKTPPSVSSGLVGWWTFDGTDVTSGAVVDRSGGGNTGNFVNIATSTFLVEGKKGQAVNFDGTNDYVSIADNNIFDPGSSDFSISLWLKNNATARTLITHYNAAGGSPGWGFGIGALSSCVTNRICFWDGSLWRTVGVFTPSSSWSHLVLVKTGTMITGYVDGVSIGSATLNATIPDSSNNLYLGTNGQVSAYTIGYMDDVRYYNRQLSVSEITQLYSGGSAKIGASKSPGSLSSGLIGYWTFDGKDIVNGVLLDKGSLQKNGSLSGIASSTFYAEGVVGQAGRFDGVDDYVDIGSNIYATADVTPGTFSTWFKLNAYPSNASYFSLFDIEGYLGQQIYGVNGAAVIRARVVSGASGATPLVLGRWYHYVQTWDGTTVNAYLNGVLDVTLSAGSVAPSSQSRANTIGASYNATQNFNGSIDETRLYGRVLSASEIKRLYTLGQPNKTSATVQDKGNLASGLASHWTFDGKDIVNGVLRDRAGSNNANLISIASSTFYVAGVMGQAGYYDGIDDYVQTTSNIVLSSNTSISIRFTFPTDTINKHLFGRNTGAQPLYPFIGMLSSATVVSLRNDSATAVRQFTFPRFAPNTWYNLTITIDANNNVRAYVNGVESSTGAINDTGTFTFNIIGGYQTASARWLGAIDDVRYYTRTLSATEVTRLYNLAR